MRRAPSRASREAAARRAARAEAEAAAQAHRAALDAARPPAPAAAPVPVRRLPAEIDRSIARWFAARGWRPFDFQRDVWCAVARGDSGLLHATTGSGKTFAVWFAALNDALREGTQAAAGLRVLWVTPMRALAADTTRALREPLADLGFSWEVGLRTGDTASGERARQARQWPAALVTTPESLTLMLTRPDSVERLAGVRLVVVDEWHELLGTKRGVQVQLALARLRRLAPALRVWGVSATLGNLPEAMAVLVHPHAGCLVEGATPKKILVDTLLPASTERFPWAGHLGMRLLDAVVREVDTAASSLVFTNTRAQCEIWYQAMLEARPDWAGLIALHHGSLDRDTREWVEGGLKHGQLKSVVCTSSLDLGVDFSPVERVLQVGSPKGVARLLQRAGRSGHAPGRASRVTLVPTNALELVEAAAARDAVAARAIESRASPDKPMDVLVQHLVTVALGTGFVPDALLDEVRGCWAYRALTDAEWAWALAFVGHGGASLSAYPEYRRVAADEAGVLRVLDARIARRHRMSIGTIVSDEQMQVRWMNGARLGTVEESFLSRLKPGDAFLFSGRILELVRIHEMSAYVRPGRSDKGAIPRWGGSKMPLSHEMGQVVLARLGQAAQGRFDGPEMRMAQPMLQVQRHWSALPTEHVLVAETLRSREGHHLFVYPLAGRHVHVGLSSLWAWRLAQRAPATFSIAANDYGFELLSPEPVDWTPLSDGSLLDEAGLLDDVLASLNTGELAQRRFREIARIAGLVFQGFPGAGKSARQLQASSSLFWEVFRKYDAANLLLTQAEREVLEQELDLGRLRASLAELRARRLQIMPIPRATPLAFPLMIQRLREKMSTEKLSDRVARMVRELEKAAA